MSSSQYLYRNSQPNDSPEIRFGRLSFSLGCRLRQDQADLQNLLAALAIVHARFASSETFEIGEFVNQSLSTCHLSIESEDRVSKLLDAIQAASFTKVAQVPENCGLVFGVDDDAGDFLQDHVANLEVFYAIDRVANELTIHYRHDLFESRSVRQWGEAFNRCLVKLCDPSQRPSTLNSQLRSIEVFDRSQDSQVLANGVIQDAAAKDFYSLTPSSEFTFPAQFQRQVERAPDRVAVWAKDQPDDDAGVQLTYRQLNQQANAIAKCLIEAGIESEDSVGLVMHRKVGLLAALIGVMKAGGRYVALEPELPLDRLSFMADDSTIQLLITETSLADRTEEIVAAMPSGKTAQTVVYGSQDFLDFTGAIDDLDQNIDAGVSSSQACYTIYTSGSTGNPKGVEICHHALVNFCQAFVKQLEFTTADTSIAMSTIAFDASVGELFPLLLIGGRVAIGHKQIGANGKQLADLIQQVDGTYMAATPTSLRVLVASGWESSPRLTVIAGGEAVTPLVRDEIMPRVKRLVNGYGPTECTVYSSFGILQDHSELVPLGGPLINARLYVLDELGQPVPPMVRGNLFIGGQSVARGYLNRPQLTAEKFVPDPFADPKSAATARMYDSGDVVYWDHDGTLHYIGRSDHQVKLRGYRIELGEIESRLKKHPLVDDAVAMVREDTPGQQRLVAYTIMAQPVDGTDLQAHLLADMPEYMVPTWFVPLKSFPTNANLKLNRRALPAPESVLGQPEQTNPDDSYNKTDRAELAVQIAKLWTEILNRRIRTRDHVFRMGADSLTSVKFQIELRESLGYEISVGQVFQFPTADSLAEQLLEDSKASSNPSIRHRVSSKQQLGQDIAVIGLAARFPGASNVTSFWENLVNGLESIRDFSEQELLAAGVTPAELANPNYVRRGSELERACDFEPEFFGVTRPDAKIISPQLRLFMKTAWEALEHAGYPQEPVGDRVGVYAGGGMPNYLAAWRHVPEPERLQRLIGNGADFLATRTSYALGLTGPAVGVQTACSTSLVAVAQACHALRSRQCEFAVAGGSSFSWPHAQGYAHGPGLIYSNDGHCRAFDSRASGTIFSHGSGAILLRPLADAIAAGDTIHAVIRGVGINNDGNRKGGYAAPSIEGQTEVIQMALRDANVSPRDITCLEAHGTGTIIGDPIEISGLTQAWRDYTSERQFCSIGSVKTNIGHADAAAGIAGLLKIILCLKHRQLVPNLNYDQPNPAIDFESSPFFVQTESTTWPSNDRRVAAVSSFGMGGTNAHLIVSQSPPIKPLTLQRVTPKQTLVSDSKEPLRLVPFSARTDQSLNQLFSRWRETNVAVDSPADFADIVFTLQQGRKHFARRSFVLCDSKASLAAALDNDSTAAPAPEHPGLVEPKVKATQRKIAFLFPGQGAQYVRMGWDLYHCEPVFRQTLDRCDSILKSKTNMGLLDWLFAEDSQRDINQTQFAQLALFSVSYSQAMLWKSWGVHPDAMIGHSIGEYAAAAVAGVMSLEDAVKMVAHRGRLMQSIPAGSMLAVMHGPTSIESLIAGRDDLDLAVVNSPSVAVVAGHDAAIDRFAGELDHQGIKHKRLHTSHAFHSNMMEPMLTSYVDIVSDIPLHAPQVPYLSNVTGTWITDSQATDTDYYARQIRSTVRFADNLNALANDDQDDLLLIEMGPGTTLTQLAKTQLSNMHVAIPTIPHPKQRQTDSNWFCRMALGQAWAAGLDLDWAKIQPQSEPPKRVALPTYQFDEQTYRAQPETIGTSPAAGQKPCWYNVPTWKQTHLQDHLVPNNAGDPGDSPTDTEPKDAVWLILADQEQLPDQLVRRLLPGDQADRPFVYVNRSDRFETLGERAFAVNPAQPADFQQLVDRLQERFTALAGVIHGWSLFDQDGELTNSSESVFWQQNQSAVIGLGWLARSIGEVFYDRLIPLTVLTTGADDVDPLAVIQPAHRALVAGCSVIQKEFPSLITKVLNLNSSHLELLAQSPSIGRLLTSEVHQPLLCFNIGQWWKPTFEQADISVAGTSEHGFSDGGVYVFTGGLGGLARNMAIELAIKYKDLKISLLARTDLPARDAWPEQLAGTNVDQAEIRQRIMDVQRLESLCELQIIKTDVSQADQVKQALAQVIARFGTIDGLLHTAGVLRDGALATKKQSDLRDVFAAKALSGSICCQAVLENHPDIKFVALFSSIAAEIGLFGQFDYSSANAYLDGLASVMNRSGIVTRSINWPAFRDVGMAAKTQQQVSDTAALMEELAANSFTVAQGTEALINIVANPSHDRVVLSHQPFDMRYDHYVGDGRKTVVVRRSAESLNASSDGQNAADRMLAIWCQQFSNDDLTLDDNYFDLGGDSLMAIGVIAKIESVFGKTIPISHLINSPTPRKLIKKIGLSDGTDQTPSISASVEHADWVVQLNDSDSGQPPIFLLHGADGAVMFYREFANRLAVDRPIFAIESPFLQNLDFELPSTVEELAKIYSSEIQRIQPEGDFTIGGYSFGGVVAFEVAQQLTQAGRTAQMTLLYDVPNPQEIEYVSATQRIRNFWNRQQTQSALVKSLELTRRVGQAFRDRATTEIENQLATIKVQNDQAGGFWRHKKCREHHMLIEQDYVPQFYPGKIGLVVADGNGSKFKVDEFLGWSTVAPHLQRIDVPGKHLELFNDPSLDQIVDATQQLIT